MTCKVYPCEDNQFLQLVNALEEYCLTKDCGTCAKSDICQRWFNNVSVQSSYGKLNQLRVEDYLRKLRAIIGVRE